jgi:hypothetical protein
MSTYLSLKPKPTFHIEDTADQFRRLQDWPEHLSRAQWEEQGPLKPLMLPCDCPWCEKAEMRIVPYEVEDRIEARIGAYRIARCDSCGAQAVAYAKMARRKERDRPTDDYKNWAKENFGI